MRFDYPDALAKDSTIIAGKFRGSFNMAIENNFPKNRRSVLFSIGASLLIHALGLWIVLRHSLLPFVPSPFPGEQSLAVTLIPSAPPSSPAQEIGNAVAASPPKPMSPFHVRKPARKPKIESSPVLASVARADSVPPVHENAQQDISSSDDMLAQIEAKRKRRAEARAQAGLPDPDNEAPGHADANDDNSIARANVAMSLRQAGQRNRTGGGGIFEVRHMGYRNAEVFFRGWSTNAGRDRTRLLEVEQGQEADIQMAVVKRMIEVIREERPGDFVWESHRLGREIVLSARPQDSEQLQQFLLKEFFPDYYSRAF